MRVFVTGATGFVGFAVATAFRRAGHDVYGLTRSAAKGPELARQEIHPVVGDIADGTGLAERAAPCSVLVHAAFEGSGGAVAKDKTAIEALVDAGRRGPEPKTLIYTSGVWVHGDTGATLVDETTPVNPIKLVAWRPAHEQLVLRATTVRGLVIRPGCVYGGRGGLTGAWFAAGAAGTAPTVVGDGRNRWAMVHADDVADAYVRAAERGLAGEVFDVTDRSRATVLEMATAAARVAGYQRELRPTPVGEARKTMGDFADALALDQHVDARKAVRLLGWQPRHGGFADEVGVCYAAWRAWQSRD
jgi:nucleoside-diphosphate-sugar epimerase